MIDNVSIVVPTYNSQQYIATSLDAIIKAVVPLFKNIELVVVNDGSVLAIDDDLTYPPENIASLVALATQPNFVVYGTVKKSSFLQFSRVVMYWLYSKKMGSSLHYFSRGWSPI
jgi:hypothetical protein